MSRLVRIIGFPMDLGADRRGVDMGPSALRIADIEEKLEALGYEVHDVGDVQIEANETLEIHQPKLKYLHEIARASELLAQAVYTTLSAGEFPLILGGDHSMSIGSLAGVSEYCRVNGKRLGVLWVDAHADMNTAESSPTGNIHGMPLAVSMGIGSESLTKIYGYSPKVLPENVFIVGLRSVDQGEKQLIKDLKVHAYSMFEVDKLGIHTIGQELLRHMNTNVDHLHISFDLDSVDPEVASGVGTPVPGGLSYREVHFLMEVVAESGLVGSMDVAEVNPILDVMNKSAHFAAGVVASTMGKRIL